MSDIVLNFNQPATAALDGNTRLRLKSVKRGGIDYLALRPSYRVSGKNTKVTVTPGAEGTSQVAISKEDIAASGAPVPTAGHNYQFRDIGYGWFILKAVEEDGTETKLVSVAFQKVEDSTETIITPDASTETLAPATAEVDVAVSPAEPAAETASEEHKGEDA